MQPLGLLVGVMFHRVRLLFADRLVYSSFCYRLQAFVTNLPACLCCSARRVIRGDGAVGKVVEKTCVSADSVKDAHGQLKQNKKIELGHPRARKRTVAFAMKSDW